MFRFNIKNKWFTTDKQPDINEKIIIITLENDVYSGIYENNKVTIPEFIGMPFFSWKHDIKFWTTKKEFFKGLE